MKSHKARLKLVERKLFDDDELQAVLPDWLADDYPTCHSGSTGERIIKPSGFLAIQPDGSVKYES